MHRYEEYIVCDGCGKELGREEHSSIFSQKRHVLNFFKHWSVFRYDFCDDCAKKAKAALDDICKKEN